MALLLDGQKFSLSSKSDTSKSVVLVKLTDSALRSLEEYLKHRAVLDKNGTAGPTIHFSQTGGAISLPSTTSDRGTISYPFGLSANEDGGPNKQSSLGCLRSTNNTLESVGTMGETLRVKATEDSAFKRIEQRFHNVKMENEKNKTVLLDDKNKNKNKKSSVISRRTPASSVAPRPAPTVPYTGLGPGRGGLHQRAISPGGPTLPAPPHNTLSNSRTSTSSPASSSSSWSPVSTGGHKEYTAAGSGMSKPTPTTNSSKNLTPAPYPSKNKYPSQHKPSKQNHSGGNPEIMKRSLRERLVHLLAIRPQKKMELHTRIYKDGIKEKDKKSNLLSTLLREVAECKANVFELKRSMWNDVNEDWPFYTAEDKAALKRRKPQNLTPPGSDTGSTSSGHSPSSTNPASPPQIQCGIKRFSDSGRFADREETNLSVPPSSKKVRVSTYRRPGEVGRTTKSPVGLLNSHGISPRGLSHLSLDVGQDSRLELNNFDREPCHDDSAPDWGQFQDGEAVVEAAVPRSPQQVIAEEVERRRSPEQLQEPEEERRPSSEPEEEDRSSSSTGGLLELTQNSNKDFIHEFSSIVSQSQRIEYKAVYNQSYEKYRHLHQVLDTVSKRAAHLENQLKKFAKGSHEYKMVKAKIKAEFLQTKSDPACQEAYSTFQYLHEKLAHIKKLVHDYDMERLGRR